jgi:hypothetical protein
VLLPFARLCSWSYSPKSDNWTFVKGSPLDVVGSIAAARYETVGVASATALPFPRYAAASFTDAAGQLWLAGGWSVALESSPSRGYPHTLSIDVWSFNVLNRQWCWRSGPMPVYNFIGVTAPVFGSFRRPSSANTPGGLSSAAAAVDRAAGIAYLYGGGGAVYWNQASYLNTIWALNLSSLQWTWLAGS